MVEHKQQVYGYYDFGVHVADFMVSGDVVLCRGRDAKTLSWGEYQPFDGQDERFRSPRHLPVWDCLQGIETKSFLENEAYARHHRVSGLVNGSQAEGRIWVQARGTFPVDYIVVGDDVVGVIGNISQGISNTLIRRGYEALSPALARLAEPVLSKPRYGVHKQETVYVPMGDGIKLAADVYLPAGLREGQRVPAVLIRTCYGKSSSQSLSAFAHYGYGVVIQDVRGREDSQGEWVPFMNEIRDGGDTVDWVAAQPWCTGSVGMYGGSYLGMTQWLAASSGTPHLKALVSVVTSGIPVRDLPHRYGIFSSGIFAWVLMMSQQRVNLSLAVQEDWDALLAVRPLGDIPVKAIGREIPFLKEWLEHDLGDSFWEQANWKLHQDKIDIPALYVSGWYDDTAGTPQTWAMNAANRRANQRLIAGPWRHAINVYRDIHDIPLGLNSMRYDMMAQYLRWYDRFLKEIDSGADQEPPVEYFTMGRDEWSEASQWPPAEARETAYYLASDGRANTRRGSGGLSPAQQENQRPDTYDYDPQNPVPHLIDIAENDCMVPADYQEVEDRADVLVYTSDVLAEDVVIAGAPRAVLYCDSSARDTDWVVRLTSVDPSGASIRLSDGVCRARYRRSFTEPELLTPGTIEEYTVEMTWTSTVFPKGHRIRAEVTSSAQNSIFPNHNTGNDFASDTKIVVAKQTVYHNQKYPSRIILPVVESREAHVSRKPAQAL